MSWRFLSQVLKKFQNTPHNQEITSFLSSNRLFVRSALKIHDLKQKFWQKLDEAAFPEDHNALKGIENKSLKDKNGKK